MGTIDRFIESMDNESAKASVINPDTQLVVSTDLFLEIQKNIGQREAENFIALYLTGKIPENSKPLLKFFKTKNDLISNFCKDLLS